MKILFIIPPTSTQVAKKYLAPTLGVAILAGLTPENYEVKIVDGNIQEIDTCYPCDLVAITVSTPAAISAFQIADRFRQRGIKVVMGGVHPTVLPEECLQHADAICKGEGELIWGELLNDYENNNLKKVYESDIVLDPIVLPKINRDLFSKKGYLINNTVLISRGCPNICEFCLVKNIYGLKYRLRTIDAVICEIAQMKTGPKPVVFVDDNIAGNKEFAKNFFKALIPLKIKWISQCSLTIAEDEELLDLAAESGCIGLFIGFESIKQTNLKAFSKTINNVENYYNLIQKIKKKKIFIHGAFIFGFDEDNENIFSETLQFAQDAKLEVANFGILTPYPGTPLFERLKSENRIFDFNWAHYDSAHVVFQPKNMTPSVLQNGQYQAMKEFYSLSSIVKRIGAFASPFLWILNFAHINVVKELKKIVEENNFN
jgi:radical SAM superfamily enzyme YgiQ (UPF0313 family)